MISANRASYAEVCRGVAPGDLEGEEIDYRRGKDKTDKSLEINKFYVNALYVAMTRAVEGLTISVETEVQHPLLRLLDLKEIADVAPTGAARRRARTNGHRRPASSNCRASTNRRAPCGRRFSRRGRRPGHPGRCKPFGNGRPRRSIPGIRPPRSNRPCSIMRCGTDRVPMSKS